MHFDERIRRYPNTRNIKIGRRFYVRNAPTKACLPDVQAHTLQDLYGLEMET